MKTLFKVLFIITFPLSNHCFSQTTYTIPWAVQQPKFVFPIYFEEGGGQRDTLYLGYDPNASLFSFNISDSIFGVIKRPLDTNMFYVKWDASQVHCGNNILCTEGFKANVCSTYSPFYFPSVNTIYCNKGILPLKISWDKSTFYTDSLPFPNQVPYPSAWARIIYGFPFCLARENYVDVFDIGGFVTASDTNGIVRDSITFYRPDGQLQSVNSGYLGFQIESWNSPTEIRNYEVNKYFNISSFENQIQVYSIEEDIMVKIYDLFGREYLSREIRKCEAVTLPIFKTNVYILVLHNSHFQITRKIIHYEK